VAAAAVEAAAAAAAAAVAEPNSDDAKGDDRFCLRTKKACETPGPETTWVKHRDLYTLYTWTNAQKGSAIYTDNKYNKIQRISLSAVAPNKGQVTTSRCCHCMSVQLWTCFAKFSHLRVRE